MYCRNCGKELIGVPEICLGCGAKPLGGSRFCHNCGAKTGSLAEFCTECGAKLDVKTLETNVSPKSRLVTTLLALFLGQFGAHRFYLEKYGTAVLMILTLGGLSIWALIDFIIAVCGAMKDKEGKAITNW